MKSVNKVFLLGNVGSDPEIRVTGGGTKVANFSLATNRRWTDRAGQKQEKTEWHRCTAWDRLADIIEQYVHKGDRLHVEGSIEYSQTEDESGKPRYWTNINVRELIMLGGSDRNSEPSPYRRPAPAPATAPTNPFADDDDDLPF